VKWEDTGSRLQGLWKAFQSLINVKRVIINTRGALQNYPVPPPLFSSASSLQLGGTLSYRLFRALLSAPKKLVRLKMDNVQGYGQFRDGVNPYDELIYPRQVSSVAETEDAEGNPLVRNHGPMIGHLLPLISHCTYLQHLSTSTIGQDDITDPAYNQTREERRYDAPAAFIASTRDALETLVFEQGILRRRSQEPPNTGIDRRTFHQVGRPTDTYFLQHILPVICSTEWKKLKRVVIRGVGGKPRTTDWNCLPPSGFKTWEQESSIIFENAESD
jgi:hypothetical protein